MPHQCLKCGKVFKEGSAELLKGCPDCGGNRFFYTKKPLDEKQREVITKKVGKDINTAIMEIIGSEGKEFIKESDGWVNINPKDIRKVVERHISRKHRNKIKDEDIEILIDEEYRRSIIEKIKEEADQSDTPETIDIERPGSYKIDLKGLLDEEPIIIQKDGSYTIHLPSVFKMIDREKK